MRSSQGDVKGLPKLQQSKAPCLAHKTDQFTGQGFGIPTLVLAVSNRLATSERASSSPLAHGG